ncbi:MAG: hypothetical protein RLZ44_1781 [Pseudomonadota bacterium]
MTNRVDSDKDPSVPAAPAATPEAAVADGPAADRRQPVNGACRSRRGAAMIRRNSGC